MAEPAAVELTAARTRLAQRHEQVLTALLAGRVPAGFDPRTTAAAGAQLRARRRHDAVRARPALAGVPLLAQVFDDYARTTPRAGCAQTDADAFGAWLAGASVPGVTADWVAAARVGSGERRWALVGQDGRRVLLVGLGRRVVHLALRRGATDEGRHDGGGRR